MSEGESVRSICRDPKMPSIATVFNWRKNNEDFLEQYAYAKDVGAESLLGEILEIADDKESDYTDDPIIGPVLNKEHIMRARLRVDTRKWYLSKVLPKMYGDKLDLTSDGKKLEPPQINIIDYRDYKVDGDDDTL